MGISGAAMLALSRHRWPGNVRELKNAMEYVAAAVLDGELQPWHLPSGIGGEEDAAAQREALEGRTPSPADAASAQPARFRPIGEEVAELERTRMAEALAAAGGNRTRAAAMIKMPLRTFVTKVKQFGLGGKKS
jgi:DNA-binding NtrC family response regulator